MPLAACHIPQANKQNKNSNKNSKTRNNKQQATVASNSKCAYVDEMLMLQHQTAIWLEQHLVAVAAAIVVLALVAAAMAGSLSAMAYQQLPN